MHIKTVDHIIWKNRDLTVNGSKKRFCFTYAIGFQNVMELTAITQNSNPVKKEVKKAEVVAPVIKCMRTPEATKGLYKCGFRCNVKLPSCRLVNHVRSYHPNYFAKVK